MAGAKKILVIDDDPVVIDALQTVLSRKGYEIAVARDGDAGLAAVEVEGPDLVIMDMMMPKKSGFLVLEKIKARDPSRPKVIMITANEGARHQAYAETLGVDDYIRKPFVMEHLVESVEKLLALST